MTKSVVLPSNVKLVRFNKKRRNKRQEYPMIGQDAVRRLMHDFPNTTPTEARSMLQELVDNPTLQLDNERAKWICELTPIDLFAMNDPADMTEVDPQILNLLLHAAKETLDARFIRSFADKPLTLVSREFLKALRQVLHYYPDETVRQTYLAEIDHLIGKEESHALHTKKVPE